MKNLGTHILIAVAAATFGSATGALAQSNINAASKYSWSENCGWMNWRDAGSPAGTQGARIHATFLSGWIWMENTGWVCLGDGTPGAGTGYANPTSGLVPGLPDFGVNRATDNTLSGRAWGENIGWISFSAGALATPANPARIDVSAQRLRGYAWSENLGWINLDNAAAYVGLDLPPANDDCASRVSAGLGTTLFNSTNAGTDGPPHNPGCLFFGNDQIGQDIWFEHIATSTGMLAIDTCGSAFDTKIAVYDGAGCVNLAGRLIACNDDATATAPGGCGAGSLQSWVGIPVTAGASYTIRIGGYDTLAGAGQMTLTFTQSAGACCCGATCTISTAAACTGTNRSFAGSGTVCNVFGINGRSPCCFADYNHNGVVSVQDIFDFLAAFFGQEGCADINGTGSLPTVQDIFDYLSAFFTGC